MEEKEKIVSESEIKTLRRLSSLLNGGELTKKEFLDAFKSVIALVVNLQSKMAEHNSDERSAIKNSFSKLKETTNANFENLLARADRAIAQAIISLKSESERRMEEMEGKVADLEDGQDADEERMIAELKKLIPKIEDIENDLPKLGYRIRDGLELIVEEEEKLDPNAIKGWKKLQADFAKAQKNGQTVRIGGGTRGMYIYVGGVKKGLVSNIDFVAGSGMAISYSKVNGRDTMTFTSSGSGSTVETPPEPPAADGSVTVFTVTAQPKYVVADGTTYFEGQGYSYAALQITFNIGGLGPASFVRAII